MHLHSNAGQEPWERDGFVVLPEVFPSTEIESWCDVIGQQRTRSGSDEAFAVRNFLRACPQLVPLVFRSTLRNLVQTFGGAHYRLVKSIYFDKPPSSNWFVAYHQDLSISVDRRAEVPGFGPWTVKGGAFGVIPPSEFLEKNFTIRIHLDDTDGSNGALRVIPGSHRGGIRRVETLVKTAGREVVCNVPRGGVVIMRPLLFHASSRSADARRRRVLHLEFSGQQLPEPLQWAEWEPGR